MIDMATTKSAGLESVEELRRAFDQSFAVPAQPRAVDGQVFLAVRTAGLPLALRLADLARLESRRKVVRLPADNPDLLGLAGIQGKLVPVYSLALLLGIDAPLAEWRWIALCGGEEVLGLAFDDLEGYLRVSPSDLLALDAAGPAREYLQQAVHRGKEVWQIIHVPSLVAAVRRRAGSLLGAC